MASEPKTSRQRIDRSQTHYPNKGPNARRRCNYCIDKKKGCYIRFGNDKCDLCIQRKQECIITAKNAAAYVEKETKRAGPVLLPAPAFLDAPLVRSQSYSLAPAPADSWSPANSLEDEDSNSFEANTFGDINFETLKNHPDRPKMPPIEEMTAGRIGAYKENYNRLERDAMNVHPSDRISDPSHFEHSEEEGRAEMSGTVGQALPHPDHFANPYMDLDDDQAAFGNMHAVRHQEMDFEGSAEAARVQMDHGAERHLGSDDSGHVAFGQSGNFSDFEESGAFSDKLFEQNADFAKSYKNAEPVGSKAAGVPIKDAKYARNLGWQPAKDLANEFAPPVRSPNGKARADAIFIDESAAPIRSPKGKERAIDMMMLEDGENTSPRGEQAGAFLSDNNNMTGSTILGTQVFDARDEMANAANFKPLMICHDPGTAAASQSESPSKSKFSNGPLQPILCCNQIKMQVYSPTYNKTEDEHNAIGTFMKKLIGKAPISVAHGPLFAGNNVWEDYQYLFATVCTDSTNIATFRLFGTNDEIDGPDAAVDINYTELFIYDRPPMICKSEDNGVDEFLIRSYGIDFNCKIHTKFSPCHAYLVHYQPKRAPLKYAQVPRQGDERYGSTITRNARHRNRRRR